MPFIIVGAGAVLLAHGDGRRQARAALLTVANPLLIWAVSPARTTRRCR